MAIVVYARVMSRGVCQYTKSSSRLNVMWFAGFVMLCEEERLSIFECFFALEPI